MEAKEWVQRSELQHIINKWAFGHYISGKDEQEFTKLVQFSLEYQNWYLGSQHQPTIKGYQLTQKGYGINVVGDGKLPIYLEVEQDGVAFRINFYHTNKHYTVEMVDTQEFQTIRGRIGQLVGI